VSLVVLGGKDDLSLSNDTMVGNALTVLAMLCWAAYTTMIRPVVQGRDPLVVTAGTLSVGAIGLSLIALPDYLHANWAAVSVAGWIGVVYSGAVVIGLGYLVWGRGVQVIGGARTSLYSNLITVAAMATAFLVLGERLQPAQLVGAVGVIGGHALARLRT
jgi:drug/metabolite transporter (DMT)-like permease